MKIATHLQIKQAVEEIANALDLDKVDLDAHYGVDIAWRKLIAVISVYAYCKKDSEYLPQIQTALDTLEEKLDQYRVQAPRVKETISQTKRIIELEFSYHST